MRSILRAEERGATHLGWLNSRHSFSFAEYHDARHMGFRSLRVINQDHVVAGAGFPPDRHRDMEMISYMLAGELSHQDNIGNQETIHRGEFQKLSAGKGVLHSDFNTSEHEDAHFLQIWITPSERGVAPSYTQFAVKEEPADGLTIVAAPSGRGPIPLHQDAWLYLGRLDKGASVSHRIEAGRGVWLQVVGGRLTVGTDEVGAGDGIAIEDEPTVEIRALERSEFLLFDLN